jgi:signal transduction histidine kinase
MARPEGVIQLEVDTGSGDTGSGAGARVHQLAKLVPNVPNRQADAAGLVFVAASCVVDFFTSPAYSPLSLYVPATIYVAWFCRRWVGWTSLAAIVGGMQLIHTLFEAPAIPFGTNDASRIATVVAAFIMIRSLRGSTLELRETKARLEDLNRDKDRLFSIISHDLKNSLAAVMTSATALDRLAHRAPPERIRAFAQLNADAARKASGLCDDLLEWARLQMNSVSMDPKELDLHTLVSSCLDTVRAQAVTHDVELQVQIPHGALTAFADRRAIETVLRNLLSNAIKFTPAGGRVGVSARAINSKFVEIAVADTGVGIEASRIPTLFALGGVGSTAGADGSSGSGLGLILCKELVERNNGRIAVTSRPQRGSRFSFVVPRAAEYAVADEAPQAQAAAGG